MVTAFVTIRMNSTRLQDKNILPIGGRPLVWRICETLLECKRVDDIYIYCSDRIILKYVPQSPRLYFIQRDQRLDGDEVTMHDIYDAFTTEVKSDVYVAALATAPFITAGSIDNGVRAITEDSYDSAFSVRRMQTFCWYDGSPVNYRLNQVPRTQVIKPLFIETCGFYAFRNEVWHRHKSRIGSNPYLVEVGHKEAIDIDTLEDYEFAQLVAANTKC